MVTYVSHITSLACLRRIYALGLTPKRVDGTHAPQIAKETETLHHAIANLTPDIERIDVLVSDAKSRRNSKGLACHVWSAPIPRRSFFEIEKGIYVSTPEFLFLQMAGQLPIPQLIQLGFELCGCYVIDPHAKRGMKRTKHPMTTPLAIAQYLQDAGNCYGYAKAMRALRWIVPNSWSPMETDVTILLTLPKKVGGYQLLSPLLNRKVYLEGEYRRRARSDHYYLDASWKNADGTRLVALEFLGDEDHTGKIAQGRDRTREIILDQLGITTFGITSYQVFRIDEFDTAVQALCKSIGCAYRKPTASQIEKKRELRRLLFARLGPNALVS